MQKAERKVFLALLALITAVSALASGWIFFRDNYARPDFPAFFRECGLQCLYLGQSLWYAGILLVPLAIGMACAAGRLRLRGAAVLVAFYFLLDLRMLEPLLAGAQLGKGFALWQQRLRGVFYSEQVWVEGLLLIAAAITFATWARRREKSRFLRRAVIQLRALTAALLALLLILALCGALTSLQLQIYEKIDAKDLPVTERERWKERVEYWAQGGDMLKWARIGGRLPLVWYGLALYAASALYCAGALERRELWQMSAVLLGVYLAVLLVTPVDASSVEGYRQGLRLLLLSPRIDSDAWAQRLPWQVYHGAQALFWAALMPGTAEGVRRLAG